MAKRIPTALLEAAKEAFAPAYTLLNDKAPQGQNGFCSNLLMSDIHDNRFLLKTITKRKVDEGVEIASQLDEIRSGQEVRNNVFIPIIDVREVDEYIFILFPYLDGNNLADYVQEHGQLNEDEVKRIMLRLLEGVAHLSENGITHQDIKPENVLITSGGDVKLLDFGSSRFQKKTYRGMTNTNRLYSAPEQILAARPGNLELLRLTCDERSDVYAIALIGHFLLTGESAFDSNQQKVDGLEPKTIDRVDVTDTLKSVIRNMLSVKLHHRPVANDAISAILTGNMSNNVEFSGKFFYTATTGSLANIKTASELEPELFDGMVIGASKIPATDADFVRNGPLTTVVDPQAYLFQSPTRMNQKFRALPYYELGTDSAGEMGLSGIRENIEALVESAIRHQIASGADIICPPFLFVTEINDDSWLLNNEINERTIELAKELRPDLPVLYAIAVAENILTSDVSRGRLLDQVTSTSWRSKIDGYMFMLESDGEVMSNESWLASAKDFVVNILSAGKPVIWNHACTASLALSFRGVSVAMGEHQSQRSFNIQHREASIRRTTPTHYVPSMFARINWPAGFDSLGTENYSRFTELTCEDSCCANVDFFNATQRPLPELQVHTIVQLARQFQAHDNAVHMRDALNTAIGHFESMRGDRSAVIRLAAQNELKPSNSNYLTHWLNALL